MDPDEKLVVMSSLLPLPQYELRESHLIEGLIVSPLISPQQYLGVTPHTDGNETVKQWKEDLSSFCREDELSLRHRGS